MQYLHDMPFSACVTHTELGLRTPLVLVSEAGLYSVSKQKTETVNSIVVGPFDLVLGTVDESRTSDGRKHFIFEIKNQVLSKLRLL